MCSTEVNQHGSEQGGQTFSIPCKDKMSTALESVTRDCVTAEKSAQ